MAVCVWPFSMCVLTLKPQDKQQHDINRFLVRMPHKKFQDFSKVYSSCIRITLYLDSEQKQFQVPGFKNYIA